VGVHLLQALFVTAEGEGLALAVGFELHRVAGAEHVALNVLLWA